MTALSLFDAMEFSTPENCLEESFGLSAEILAADIGSEGSILDSDFGHLDCLKYEPEPPTSKSLDDVLLEVADSLGQEWMENVDLKSLLNPVCSDQLPFETSPPEIIHSPEEPTTSKLSLDSEPEPLKEGLRASAYEKLKALLTDGGPIEQVQSSIPTPPQSPLSPEATVPNLSFVAPSFDSLLEESGENVLEDLIQLQSAVSTSSNIENIDIRVQNPIDLVELLSPVTDVNQSLNSSDNDSYLASIPPSPSDSYTLETVDLEKLREVDSVTSSDTGSQTSDHEFTKLKSKSKKDNVRSAPYEVESPCIEDKKDRKKVQNKNAATRYRVKKRQEKESLQKQESDLADKNKELREKVESLQREISYMKELMNEIYKAKKSKI